MNTCFDCGGKLKVVSKPGRMAWDEEDDELYEIPVELKISTCVECGQPFEDDFVKAKISNAIRGQKKSNPGPRLLQLRWIDNQINKVLKRPKAYGNKASVYCQIVRFLEFREMILSKGTAPKSKQIQDGLNNFLRKQWPSSEAAPYPKDISLEDDLAPVLREFCDVWINT